MKKLMIIAAAATLAVVAEGVTVRQCASRKPTCPVVAFKVTANGKIAAEAKSGEYKSTTKLQIKKGALVIFATENGAVDGDTCCYEAYSLYLKVKVNKEDYPVGVFFQPLEAWSIFGKKFNKLDSTDKKKKGNVESQIGLSYAVSSGTYGNVASAGNNNPDVNAGSDTVAGGTGLDIDMGLADFAFIATAFGKGTYRNAYTDNSNPCQACAPQAEQFTPGTYSGWFAGVIEQLSDEQGCLMCTCDSLDVFGGTWKAKYDSKWSIANGWQKAATYVFGGSTLNQMLRGGDPDADPKDQANWIE